MNSDSPKKSAKRDLILRAAGECFARYGYDKTTLDDIGAMARLNKASLYYYFKSKESIFLEVVLEEAAKFMEALQTAVAALRTPEEKIQFYLKERLSYYEKVLNLHQLSLEGLRTLEPAFDELYREVKAKEIAFLGQLIQTGIDSGVFEPVHATQIAEGFLLISDAVKHEKVRNTPRLRIEEVDYSSVQQTIQDLVYWMLRGLRVRSEG